MTTNKVAFDIGTLATLGTGAALSRNNPPRFLSSTGHQVQPSPDVMDTFRQNYNETIKPWSWEGLTRRFGVKSDANSPPARLSQHVHRLSTNPDIGDISIPRVMMPKSEFSAADLHRMGYRDSLVAVPERGQAQITNYRHPDTNYHLHDHDDLWSMHKDKYPSGQMVLLKRQLERAKKKNFGDKVQSTWNAAGRGINDLYHAAKKSAPHVVLEGIPGYANYAWNQIVGAPTFKDHYNFKHGKIPKPNINPWRAALGIGATGLGGLALYNMLKSDDDEEEERDEQQEKAAAFVQRLLSAS